jgi:small GTP-binding protein
MNIGYKIVLIGDAGVGKSSLLAWLMNDKSPTQPTVGAAYAIHKIKINENEIRLSIWDTAGQERYRSLGPIYYRNSLGCLCVFDLANKSSFKNLKQWITDYRFCDQNENKQIIIVANKCDCERHLWCTTEENIKTFAEENKCDYILTNCVDGTNVNKAFYKLSESIYEMSNTIIPDVIIDNTNISNKNQLLELAEKIIPTKIPFMSIQC